MNGLVFRLTYRTLASVFVASLFVGQVSTLSARPPHKQALADHFGNFLAKPLHDCRTCHLPDKKGQDESDKPHNPFGARLAVVREELRKAGKKITIPDRLTAVADEDSDGDGTANILELLSGHFPGDAADKPTAEDLAKARTTLAAFLKARAGYAWKPLEPVKKPAVPLVKNTAWVRNPIDAFIAAEHEARQLTPRPEAAKAVLLRRVTLDLIGLPPTPAELNAFLVDDSTTAYEKVVDRLLSSPRYGERWGRHWMDVWRYADWAGYGAQVRDSQPHIWRWRDWIVESLNDDKGYDRMVQEMLAGDELEPTNPDALAATGFLVRNYKLLSREKWMQDTVEHTFQAFLGTTLGCARCHDHMFDPLLQKEYYRVRAIFEPHQVRIDRLPGQPDTTKDGLPHAYDGEPTPTYLFLRGDDRTPDKSAPILPGVPEALGGRFADVTPVSLPKSVTQPDRREFVIRETVAASEGARVKARNDLAAARSALVRVMAGAVGADPLALMVLGASTQKARDTRALAEREASFTEARHAALTAVLKVEDLEEAGRVNSEEWKAAATETVTYQRQSALEEAKRNLVAGQQALRGAANDKAKADATKKIDDATTALTKAEADLKMPPSTAYAKRALLSFPSTSTGRRSALARWIVDTSNPLTARVAMNHVWLRHFGQAIVPSVFDFGRNGRPPSHPGLLDWLAAEFMDRGWSMKAMHRLMVTSNTYRLASTFDEANSGIDRDNVFLWRFASRRLEAEAVRDGIFFVAGQLDQRMGGPDIDHNQGLTIPRRSLYFRHASEKQMEFLKLFDAASVTECYQRKDSVLPQQALALNNSELTSRLARLLAAELEGQAAGDTARFVTMAFERVLGRTPTAEESSECVKFLRDQSAARSRESLVHVLLNHHEFVTVR